MISLLHPDKHPSWQRSSQPREPLYLRKIKADTWKHLNTLRHTWKFKKMHLWGNFNSTERYLLSLMFLIEPIWIRQPVSQPAAQLGFFQAVVCILLEHLTMMWGHRSRANIHCIFPLIRWSSVWTGPVVLGHARPAHMKRFNDQYHFVCPSVCDDPSSQLTHPTQRRRSQSFLLMLWHFSIVSRNQTPACWRSRRMRCW